MLEGDGCEFFEGGPGKIATKPDEFVVRVNERVEFWFREQSGGKVFLEV